MEIRLAVEQAGQLLIILRLLYDQVMLLRSMEWIKVDPPHSSVYLEAR